MRGKKLYTFSCDFCNKPINKNELYFIKSYTACISDFPVKIYKDLIICPACYTTFEILKPEQEEITNEQSD